MVMQNVDALISDEIKARRDEYLQLMHDHGLKTPDAIIESVRATQSELLATFRSCSDERAARAPAEGEWNMRELALHAVFTERLIAKLVHHMGRGTTPPAEAFEGAGIGMITPDDGRPYSAIMRDLAEVNEALLTSVRELPDAPNVEMKLPHPYFGPLNCLEWAGFQRVHDTDHIQHAQKILARRAGVARRSPHPARALYDAPVWSRRSSTRAPRTASASPTDGGQWPAGPPRGNLAAQLSARARRHMPA